MDVYTVIPYLFLATFVVAIIFGVIQYKKSRKARDEHHHSVTERKATAAQQGQPPR